MSDTILKITAIFNDILAKYVITQIHACTEESEPGLC